MYGSLNTKTIRMYDVLEFGILSLSDILGEGET